MIPFLKLGPVTIPTYGLLLAIAFLAALWLTAKEFERRKLGRNAGWDTGIVAMLAGLVGAKINYLLEHPEQLSAPLKDFFAGMTWYGGFLLGLGAVLIYWRSRRVPILTGLDATTPAVVLGYALARIGCQLSGDGDYGTPSNLPWAMAYPRGLVPTLERVHPTPLYETLFMSLFFLILWRLRLRNPVPGTIFGLYLVVYGVERFLIEFIRRNPAGLFGLTEAQLMSVLIFIAGILLLAFRTQPLKTRL